MWISLMLLFFMLWCISVLYVLVISGFIMKLLKWFVMMVKWFLGVVKLFLMVFM